MGNYVRKNSSSLYDTLPHRGTSHLVMLGLDSAGKTTILYNLKLGRYVNTVPTIGFNCEKIKGQLGKARGANFHIWDVGGREKLRPLWRSYTRSMDGIIFVLDSTDMERMEEAKLELLQIFKLPANSGVPILILANKQDLSDAKDAKEIHKFLDLYKFSRVPQSYLWHIEPTCAITGEGLQEGLTMLYEMILQRKKLMKEKNKA